MRGGHDLCTKTARAALAYAAAGFDEHMLDEIRVRAERLTQQLAKS
jgi:hypothetical protein